MKDLRKPPSTTKRKVVSASNDGFTNLISTDTNKINKYFVPLLSSSSSLETSSSSVVIVSTPPVTKTTICGKQETVKKTSKSRAPKKSTTQVPGNAGGGGNVDLINDNNDYNDINVDEDTIIIDVEETIAKDNKKGKDALHLTVVCSLAKALKFDKERKSSERKISPMRNGTMDIVNKMVFTCTQMSVELSLFLELYLRHQFKNTTIGDTINVNTPTISLASQNDILFIASTLSGTGKTVYVSPEQIMSHVSNDHAFFDKDTKKRIFKSHVDEETQRSLYEEARPKAFSVKTSVTDRISEVLHDIYLPLRSPNVPVPDGSLPGFGSVFQSCVKQYLVNCRVHIVSHIKETPLKILKALVMGLLNVKDPKTGKVPFTFPQWVIKKICKRAMDVILSDFTIENATLNWNDLHLDIHTHPLKPRLKETDASVATSASKKARTDEDKNKIDLANYQFPDEFQQRISAFIEKHRFVLIGCFKLLKKREFTFPFKITFVNAKELHCFFAYMHLLCKDIENITKVFHSNPLEITANEVEDLLNVDEMEDEIVEVENDIPKDGIPMNDIPKYKKKYVKSITMVPQMTMRPKFIQFDKNEIFFLFPNYIQDKKYASKALGDKWYEQIFDLGFITKQKAYSNCTIKSLMTDGIQLHIGCSWKKIDDYLSDVPKNIRMLNMGLKERLI